MVNETVEKTSNTAVRDTTPLVEDLSVKKLKEVRTSIVDQQSDFEAKVLVQREQFVTRLAKVDRILAEADKLGVKEIE